MIWLSGFWTCCVLDYCFVACISRHSCMVGEEEARRAIPSIWKKWLMVDDYCEVRISLHVLIEVLACLCYTQNFMFRLVVRQSALLASVSWLLISALNVFRFGDFIHRFWSDDIYAAFKRASCTSR